MSSKAAWNRTAVDWLDSVHAEMEEDPAFLEGIRLIKMFWRSSLLFFFVMASGHGYFLGLQTRNITSRNNMNEKFCSVLIF